MKACYIHCLALVAALHAMPVAGKRTTVIPFKWALFRLYLLIVCLHTSPFSDAQNPEWMVFDTSNSPLPHNRTTDLTIDARGNIWVATLNGVAMYDKQGWVVYTSSNSPIPHNVCYKIEAEGDTIWIGSVWGLVRFDGTSWQVFPSLAYTISMAFEPNGTKWFGGWADALYPGGLYRYDGTTWAYYDTLNSGLPSNRVMGITVDQTGKKWIATAPIASGGGLVSFDGTNWTLFNTSNSGIPHNQVNEVAIAPNNHIWVSTPVGVGRYDMNTWVHYHTGNSPLPSNTINAQVAFEGHISWIGSLGLVKYDDTTWTVFNQQNSGIGNDFISDIAIDKYGNKWIGTGKGVSVYRQGGVILSSGPTPETEGFIAAAYPNPFREIVNLSISGSNSSEYIFEIYDMSGKKLFDQRYNITKYSAWIEAISLESLLPGIYLMKVKNKSHHKFIKLIKI